MMGSDSYLDSSSSIYEDFISLLAIESPADVDAYELLSKLVSPFKSLLLYSMNSLELYFIPNSPLKFSFLT